MMKIAYIPILLLSVACCAVNAASTNPEGEFQNAELTGKVDTTGRGEFLEANNTRYQMMFTDPRQKRMALEMDGKTVRVEGQIDRNASQKLFWVDRFTRIEPIGEHNYARPILDEEREITASDDQPVGDSHFRGKAVLDMPFQGAENETIYPKLHLRW